MMARDQIALTPQQVEAVRGHMEKTQARSEEQKKKLEAESAALVAMVTPARVDEKAVLAQLDKVLDVEREVKHLHVGLITAVKNLLTPGQQETLRRLGKDGGAKVGEEKHQRLTEKLARVQQAAQDRAASGRDPSDVLRNMEQKFKPLMEAGKTAEAEALLDTALEQLKQDAK